MDRAGLPWPILPPIRREAAPRIWIALIHPRQIWPAAYLGRDVCPYTFKEADSDDRTPMLKYGILSKDRFERLLFGDIDPLESLSVDGSTARVCCQANAAIVGIALMLLHKSVGAGPSGNHVRSRHDLTTCFSVVAERRRFMVYADDGQIMCCVFVLGRDSVARRWQRNEPVDAPILRLAPERTSFN